MMKLNWQGKKSVSSGTWVALLRLYKVYRQSLSAAAAREEVTAEHALLLNPLRRVK